MKKWVEIIVGPLGSTSQLGQSEINPNKESGMDEIAESIELIAEMFLSFMMCVVIAKVFVFLSLVLGGIGELGHIIGPFLAFLASGAILSIHYLLVHSRTDVQTRKTVDEISQAKKTGAHIVTISALVIMTIIYMIDTVVVQEVLDSLEGEDIPEGLEQTAEIIPQFSTSLYATALIIGLFGGLFAGKLYKENLLWGSLYATGLGTIAFVLFTLV